MRKRTERMLAAQGRVPDASESDIDSGTSIVDVAIDIIVSFNSVQHGTAVDPSVFRRWTAHKLLATANGIVGAFTTRK